MKSAIFFLISVLFLHPPVNAQRTGGYPNLFLDAGYSQQAIDLKITKAYQDIFEGPNRVYFEVGDSMGYVSDVKNHDARTEGLSYGMMIAVQLDKKEVFDRIWRWSKKYLQHQTGPREGYFAWSINPATMKRNSEGSASDGELYFITSLLFASNRWGNSTGIDYYHEARRILDAMWKKDGTGNIFNLINTQYKQITFVPEGNNYGWTDPSYHLPAFYEAWALYAKDGHEQFYRDCADSSRAFLHRACNEQTGLTTDYAEFSGAPHPTSWMPPAFRYDSWRVPMNIAMDYVWFGKDKTWQTSFADHFQGFLRSKGIDTFGDQFNPDGSTPDFILGAGGFKKLRHSLGLLATAASASLMLPKDHSKDFIQALWNAKLEPYSDGYFDPYYDGLLYLFSLMHLSGKYRLITPQPRPASVSSPQSHKLWLQDSSPLPVTVTCNRTSPTLSIAIQELRQGWQGIPGDTVRLFVRSGKSGKPDPALKKDGFRIGHDSIQANTDLGILYGAYALLRSLQTRQLIQDPVSNPSYESRILDHWDNPDGSVERGYAGPSIFWRKEDAFVITPGDSIRWQEYARANASIGINGSVLNNVNASPMILTKPYLTKAAVIAGILRPYGIKVFLSVNFSSPKLIGGLPTSDPLDPSVIKWWKDKCKEIHTLIPDFGGFLVKANSEGQPGPQDFGRTHADGANTLADALQPYGGLVMWRAFVYNPNEKDRAKQAYAEFLPLDGRFRDNVIIQVKNGPIDFQPREPFSPLFGAMRSTSLMPEFQITQEYLGHSIHLVFLSPMWEECLQSNTYRQGTDATVARCTDGSIFPQRHTAIAGVANIGLDNNWCGHDFAQANWYAFGRLAWNNALHSEQIAEEWLGLTFTDNMRTPGREANFLRPVKQMMLDSREAAVDYMTPLGLHHIMAANIHYGPGPWWAPPGTRADWTPPYYHKANATGIGFNRTATGSDAISQYGQPLAAQFGDPASCPEKYLLWFHHLPWNYTMKSGRSLWDELCYHYDHGVAQVRNFQKIWDRVQPYVDVTRFLDVQRRLRSQCANAILWKDACLLYFQQYSRMPIPFELERPLHNLDDIIAADRQPGN